MRTQMCRGFEMEGQMMGKFRRWLYNRFLPACCKDELMEANVRLMETVKAQKQEIDRLDAYINGMETALRHQRRVTVRNEVKRE